MYGLKFDKLLFSALVFVENEDRVAQEVKVDCRDLMKVPFNKHILRL